MTTFAEMPYKRPDLDAVKAEYKKWTEQLRTGFHL